MFACGEECLTSGEDLKLHLDLLEQSVGVLNQIAEMFYFPLIRKYVVCLVSSALAICFF